MRQEKNQLFRMMNITGILIFLLSLHATAQRNYDWRTNIDMIVQETDSLSLKSQRTFYLNKILKVDRTFRNDKTIKETWNYTLNKGKVILFQVNYVVDSSEFLEIYYLNDNRLICMEQYESPYFTRGDEIKWGKVLFFVNDDLRLSVKVGQAQQNELYRNSATAALSSFDKRFSELQRNLR